MKKIMFSDRLGLTQAVLEGRKTMTRRIVNLCENDLHFMKISDRGEYLFCSKTVLDGEFPRYKVGEILAVAQRYKEIIGDRVFFVSSETGVSVHRSVMEREKGWTNKMNVAAEFMPHRIRITDIKVERLQDINAIDCLKEGIFQWGDPFREDRAEDYGFVGATRHYLTPREAFAALIDKVSGKDTWDRNPWVFVYEFELVKGDKQ